MRKLTNILIFAALLIHLNGARAEICGLMKAQTEAETGGGGGSVTLYEGEILPVKSKSKTRNLFNLLLAGKPVGVPRETVKLLSGVKCAPRASTVPSNTPTFLQPEGGSGGPQLSPETSFDVISETKSGGQRWLRVALNGHAEYWIVKRDEVREKGVAPKGPRIWKFGFELGLLRNLSAESYEGLVTSVPNSSNVGALQDPIITGVDKGTGRILRLFAERPVWKLLHARYGLGYRSEKYSYEYKTNPSLGAVTLGELSGAKRDIEINRVQLDAGMAVQQQADQFTFVYGFQVAALYNLSGQEEVDVLVPSGVFFKNTPAKVKAGPSQIEIETWLRGDVRWRGAALFLGLGLKGETMMGLGYSF